MPSGVLTRSMKSALFKMIDILLEAMEITERTRKRSEFESVIDPGPLPPTSRRRRTLQYDYSHLDTRYDIDAEVGQYDEIKETDSQPMTDDEELPESDDCYSSLRFPALSILVFPMWRVVPYILNRYLGDFSKAIMVSPSGKKSVLPLQKATGKGMYEMTVKPVEAGVNQMYVEDTDKKMWRVYREDFTEEDVCSPKASLVDCARSVTKNDRSVVTVKLGKTGTVTLEFHGKGLAVWGTPYQVGDFVDFPFILTTPGEYFINLRVNGTVCGSGQLYCKGGERRPKKGERNPIRLSIFHPIAEVEGVVPKLTDTEGNVLQVETERSSMLNGLMQYTTDRGDEDLSRFVLLYEGLEINGTLVDFNTLYSEEMNDCLHPNDEGEFFDIYQETTITEVEATRTMEFDYEIDGNTEEEQSISTESVPDKTGSGEVHPTAHPEDAISVVERVFQKLLTILPQSPICSKVIERAMEQAELALEDEVKAMTRMKNVFEMLKIGAREEQWEREHCDLRTKTESEMLEEPSRYTELPLDGGFTEDSTSESHTETLQPKFTIYNISVNSKNNAKIEKKKKVCDYLRRVTRLAEPEALINVECTGLLAKCAGNWFVTFSLSSPVVSKTLETLIGRQDFIRYAHNYNQDTFQQNADNYISIATHRQESDQTTTNFLMKLLSVMQKTEPGQWQVHDNKMFRILHDGTRVSTTLDELKQIFEPLINEVFEQFKGPIRRRLQYILGIEHRKTL